MHSYIELSKSKLIKNYNIFRKFLPEHTKIMCVLKGNAYGRGIPEVVQILNEKADYFAVDDIYELRTVRLYSQKPTFVMGYLDTNDLYEAIKLNADISVFDNERLLQIDEIGAVLRKKPRVHIELDAFFGRMGVSIIELPSILEIGKRLKNVEIFSIYAHFSSATERKRNTHDEKQIKIYKNAINICQEYGFSNIKHHISSTSGTVIYEKGQNDFVRIGAALYGMWTSEEVKKVSLVKGIAPVMRWISHIAQVRTLPKNYPVGYSREYITKKTTKIAIIPQGYADGYDCKLSNKGDVLIHKARCRVLGRVSMNMITVDVTHIIDKVKEGDEVVIIGKQGREDIAVEELAYEIGTMHAEVTSKLSSLLPRIIVN